MFAADFVEPAWVWLCIFGGDDFDNVATVEFGIESYHLAVDDSSGATGSNLTMESIGEVERH